jgi:hypothetical protein
MNHTPSYAKELLQHPNVQTLHLTSGAAAAATSLFKSSAVSTTSSSGLPSNKRLHHQGGSSGLCPLCNGGQTSAKKYHTCPMTTPSISSFGTTPCNIRLKPIKTHGRYGAVKTNNPKKLNLVSGLRLAHMYTRVEESGWPMNGIETKGERQRRHVVAYKRSHEKCAGERPDDSSNRREYR